MTARMRTHVLKQSNEGTQEVNMPNSQLHAQEKAWYWGTPAPESSSLSTMHHIDWYVESLRPPLGNCDMCSDLNM